jgi:hypothetical protein
LRSFIRPQLAFHGLPLSTAPPITPGNFAQLYQAHFHWYKHK